MRTLLCGRVRTTCLFPLCYHRNDIAKGIDFVSSSKDEDVSEPEEQVC